MKREAINDMDKLIAVGGCEIKAVAGRPVLEVVHFGCMTLSTRDLNFLNKCPDTVIIEYVDYLRDYATTRHSILSKISLVPQWLRNNGRRTQLLHFNVTEFGSAPNTNAATTIAEAAGPTTIYATGTAEVRGVGHK